MNKLKKGLFDPKTAFFSLPIVKWTMATGTLLITIVCLLIIFNSSRDLDLRAEGFNEFYKMMRFPTFLLGFFAALLALFATNHRSEQNKAAMNLAEAQNRFSNYYKHIEEYNNYLSNQFERYPEGVRPIVNIQKLHRCLYQNAKSEGIQMSSNIEHRIFDEALTFLEHLIKTDFSTREDVDKLIIEIDNCCKEINSALLNSIAFNPPNGSINFISENGKIKIPAARVQNFLTFSVTKIEMINAILHFEETYDSDFLEKLISNIKAIIDYVPDISVGGSGIIDWLKKNDISLEKEFEVLRGKQIYLHESSKSLFQKIRGS